MVPVALTSRCAGHLRPQLVFRSVVDVIIVLYYAVLRVQRQVWWRKGYENRFIRNHLASPFQIFAYRCSVKMHKRNGSLHHSSIPFISPPHSHSEATKKLKSRVIGGASDSSFGHFHSASTSSHRALPIVFIRRTEHRKLSRKPILNIQMMLANLLLTVPSLLAKLGLGL
jgi:hypothetical protein